MAKRLKGPKAIHLYPSLCLFVSFASLEVLLEYQIDYVDYCHKENNTHQPPEGAP
jgi:hypothetical protein